MQKEKGSPGGEAGQTRLHLPSRHTRIDLRNMSGKSEAGQILLIVILVIIVASTIGLSLASRTITSLRSSTEEAESQKALAAAETGIERAIQGNVLQTGVAILTGENPSNKSSYFTDITQIQSSSFLINGGNVIPKDEGADVWLSTNPNFTSPINTNLTVYWTVPSGACSTYPAIEIAVVSGNRTTPNMTRYVVDSCDSRRAQNSFGAPNRGATTISGQSFNFGFALPAISSGYIVRIIPLYADSTIGAVSTTPLPPQGYIINSTGKSGNTTRKVTVFRGFPRLPIEFFPYNLFLP